MSSTSSGHGGHGGHENSPTGCALTSGISTPGYLAKFFPYTLGDANHVSDKSYYESGYQNKPVLALIPGVSLVNFVWTDPVSDPKVPVQGLIYGFDVTATNFTMELTGYFIPRSLGTHVFEISNINDGVAVFIGDGNAFQCGELLSKKFTSEYLFATGPDDISQGSAELQAGVYYPVRLVFVNAESDASLSFNVIGPDGSSIPVVGSIFNFLPSTKSSSTVGMSSTLSSQISSTTSNESTSRFETFTTGSPPSSSIASATNIASNLNPKSFVPIIAGILFFLF